MRPLELLIERYDYGKDYTQGRVFVDGMYFGESMEPYSRHLSNSMPLSEIKKKKIAGKTAIPTGRYKVTLAVSSRLKNRSYAKKYGGKFPLLNNVPGFSGILLHPLNRGPESAGCLGVGEYFKPGLIARATQGHYDLMDYYLVPAINKGQEVYITIKEV